MTFPKFPLLPTIVSVLVGVAIITGLILSGSPQNERLRRYDAERLSELQQVRYSIDAYLEAYGSLPDNLAIAIKNSSMPEDTYMDPETQAYYDYTVTSDSDYELCAIFSLSSNEQTESVGAMWMHDQGYACFPIHATKNGSIENTRKIDMGIQPVEPTIIP